MSDFLNFLAGLGGGYIKGADLSSKRKQALETAKLNNAIRQNTLNQQAEQNDLTTYQRLVDSYDKSIKDANEGINAALTPNDQANIAFGYAPGIKSKFDDINRFAKSSRHVQARGFGSPSLPAWVENPSNYSGFASGAMLPKPSDWNSWSTGLSKFTRSPADLTKAYVSRYSSMLRGNFDPKQIDTVLNQFPVDPKHDNLRDSIKGSLLSMAPAPAQSVTAAPATQTPTPGLPNAQPPSVQDNFNVGAMTLVDGRRFNPAPPVNPGFSLGDSFITRGQVDPSMGGPLVDGPIIGRGQSFAEKLKALGSQTSNQAIPPDDGMTQQSAGGMVPPQQTSQIGAGEYGLTGSGIGAMTGEYSGLGGYTVPAEPPVKKTQEQIEAEAYAKYDTAAQRGKDSAFKFVAQQTGPRIDKKTGEPIPDPRVTDVNNMIQKASEEFNRRPQIKFKDVSEFMKDEFGFDRTSDEAIKLADAYNGTQRDLEKSWADRQVAVKGLVDMVTAGIKLPGELKKIDLENMDKVIDIAIKDMMTAPNLKKALAEAQTAVVNSVWAAAKIKADIEQGNLTANAAVTNAETSRLKVQLDGASEPLKELSSIRKDRVNAIKGNLSSYTNELTNVDIAGQATGRTIETLTFKDAAVTRAVNDWAKKVNTFGKTPITSAEDVAEEDRLFRLIPANAQHMTTLTQHRTNMTRKKDLVRTIDRTRHDLNEATNELGLIDQAYEKIKRAGITLLDYQMGNREATEKAVKSDKAAEKNKKPGPGKK